jgi:hypothetical protein
VLENVIDSIINLSSDDIFSNPLLITFFEEFIEIICKYHPLEVAGQFPLFKDSFLQLADLNMQSFERILPPVLKATVRHDKTQNSHVFSLILGWLNIDKPWTEIEKKRSWSVLAVEILAELVWDHAVNDVEEDGIEVHCDTSMKDVICKVLSSDESLRRRFYSEMLKICKQIKDSKTRVSECNNPYLKAIINKLDLELSAFFSTFQFNPISEVPQPTIGVDITCFLQLRWYLQCFVDDDLLIREAIQFSQILMKTTSSESSTSNSDTSSISVYSAGDIVNSNICHQLNYVFSGSPFQYFSLIISSVGPLSHNQERTLNTAYPSYVLIYASTNLILNCLVEVAYWQRHNEVTSMGEYPNFVQSFLLLILITNSFVQCHYCPPSAVGNDINNTFPTE